MEDFKIDINTTPAQIHKAIGKSDREAIRESMQRRERLERLATMHAGEEVYVQISGEKAYADIAGRSSRMGYTDRLIINVPAVIPDQVVTNMDPETWDLLFQKTEMYHELGHILYSDWPSFEDCIFGDDDGNFGVPEHHQAFYKSVWNILEDATIESSNFLAGRFNIEDDLRVKNENVLRQNEQTGMHGLKGAIQAKVMEYKHPIGWVDTLLDQSDDSMQFIHSSDRDVFVDEIIPLIENMAPRYIEEGDPVVRNRIAYGLYKQIEPHLDDAVAPGDPDEEFDFGFPDDGEENEGSEGMTVDAEEDPDHEVEFEPSGVEEDLQRDYSQQVKSDKDQVDPQANRKEMEAWARVIQKDYDLDSTLSLTIPSDPPDEGSYDDATRQEAERLSGPLSKELGNRLQHENRTKKKVGQKSGKIDGKRAHKSQQGKTNIMKNHTEPDEKDYSCILIDDRSGSINSFGGANMVSDIEESSGALAFALEDLGIDVAQFSLLDDEIHLEKDFSESVDQARKKMFRGAVKGGTPLSDALALARGRLEERGGHPFVIVLTDGKPDHRERYRDQLHLCDFPVVGIYVDRKGEFDEDQMNESAYFHHLEVRRYDEALKGVRNMVKRVMF